MRACACACAQASARARTRACCGGRLPASARARSARRGAGPARRAPAPSPPPRPARQVAEPRQDNSGITQGIFVRRHRVPRDGGGGGALAPADLAVGAAVVVYGRAMRLVDADAFTRAWYAASLGVEQGPAEGYPAGQARRAARGGEGGLPRRARRQAPRRRRPRALAPVTGSACATLTPPLRACTGRRLPRALRAERPAHQEVQRPRDLRGGAPGPRLCVGPSPSGPPRPQPESSKP